MFKEGPVKRFKRCGCFGELYDRTSRFPIDGTISGKGKPSARPGIEAQACLGAGNTRCAVNSTAHSSRLISLLTTICRCFRRTSLAAFCSD